MTQLVELDDVLERNGWEPPLTPEKLQFILDRLGETHQLIRELTGAVLRGEKEARGLGEEWTKRLSKEAFGDEVPQFALIYKASYGTAIFGGPTTHLSDLLHKPPTRYPDARYFIVKLPEQETLFRWHEGDQRWTFLTR